MNAEQGMQFTDLFGFARRRGKLIALVAGGVILATFWIAMALPNHYTSSSMILVEPQTVDEDLVASGVRESDLNERLGLMTAEILSRNRLSKIIDDVGLYEEESKRLERQEVIDLMRSYVSVEPVLSELEVQGPLNRPMSFNTFRIIFRNENPHTAAQVAQQIATNFIDANIDARTKVTAKSLDFMQDEIKALSDEILKIEKAVSEVKAENPGRLPEDLASNQRLLQFAMNDLRDAQRTFDAAKTDAAFWQNQAMMAGESLNSSDVTSPGRRLRTLELELGNLLARGFTSKHPDVVRVESEVALLKTQIETNANVEGGPPQSLPQQNAMSEQRRADLRSVSAEADISRLREVVAEIEARLGGTPAVAERLDGLDRQYDHLYRSYQDFSSRLQQAGVQADLERRQLGEQFRILEFAFAAPAPSSPNRILILVLGALLGLTISFGVGFVAELADTSVHTSNDLQSSLGIPVLVSVPKIMLESDRAARSSRIIRESLAAIALVLFCLFGGVATYYFVNGRVGGSEEAVEDEATPEVEARLDLGTGRG